MMIHNFFGVYKLRFDRHENQIAFLTLKKQCSHFTVLECDRKCVLNNFKLITMNYFLM